MGVYQGRTTGQKARKWGIERTVNNAKQKRIKKRIKTINSETGRSEFDDVWFLRIAGS